MIHYLPFLLLFIGGSVLTLGDIVMKKWVNNNDFMLFVVGLLIYLVGLIFLAYSYRYKNIAVASSIFVVCNIVTLAFVSWFYFHETLTPIQMGGIILGIGSVVLLEIA